MSQEVDQRVVEMRFNNANFEKNTKKTISSIDKLMEKLQFKGAEKGLEKLDKAAKDVDLGVIARSVETLEERFSALNVVATAALVNNYEPSHKCRGEDRKEFDSGRDDERIWGIRDPDQLGADDPGEHRRQGDDPEPGE